MELVSRIQKGQESYRIAKKEMVEANLRLVISDCKKIHEQRSTVSRFNSRGKYWINDPSSR